MLEILKFCFSSGWNLFATILLIIVSGYAIRNIFEGVTEIIAAKIKK